MMFGMIFSMVFCLLVPIYALFLIGILAYPFFYDRAVRQVPLEEIDKNSSLRKQVQQRDIEKGYMNVDWWGNRATSIGEYGGYVL